MIRKRDPVTGQYVPIPESERPVKPPADPPGWKPNRARKDGAWMRRVKRVYAALDEDGMTHLGEIRAHLGPGTSEGDAVRWALREAAARGLDPLDAPS